MAPSLTSHLLNLSPAAYRRATQHPFLEAAGNGSIAQHRLEGWLTQDRIYAFVGYPKFIALLTSRTDLDADPALAALLAFSLSNVAREVTFFDHTAHAHGLNIARQPSAAQGVEHDLTRAITKGYVDFMIATGATGGVGEGLVLLWAMEKCYFDAWTHARAHMHMHAAPPSSAPMARALEAFIHNWTSPEFKAFVDECAALLDAHAATLSAGEYEDLRAKAEEIWRWTLWYEERFWDGE